MGLIPEPPSAGETSNEATAREERNAEQSEVVKDLMRAEMKIFADRRKYVVGELSWVSVPQPYKKN